MCEWVHAAYSMCVKVHVCVHACLSMCVGFCMHSMAGVGDGVQDFG